MIGESQNQENESPNKAFIAFRDALVVFLLILVTNLIAVQGVPTPEQVWKPFLAGLLMGIISYMHALGIKKPEE